MWSIYWSYNYYTADFKSFDCLLMGSIRPCHAHTYREKMFSRWQLHFPLYASFWSTSSTSCQELGSYDCPWHQPPSAQLFASWDLSLRGPRDLIASPRCTLSLPALVKSLSLGHASVPWTLHTVSCESLICDRNRCDFSGAKQEVWFLFSAPCFWYPTLWFSVRAEMRDADLFFISSHQNIHLQDKRSIKYEIAAKLNAWNLYLSGCGKCQNNKSLKGTVSSGILARAVMSTHCQAVFKAQSGILHAFSLAEHLCDWKFRHQWQSDL